ncbi:MAG: ABC transporter ATP-binding protein [Firmicutes bacterium]|nr:ABC transporter ATP-binding protein [Bacillota bacterium]
MEKEQLNGLNAIELKGINKSFGSVVANKNIDLTVRKGEILALLGENGSGKTTLMNMLSGIYRPDSGSVFVYGQEVHIYTPQDALNLGIGMIHQHYKLVDNLSAAENIVLGTKTKKQSMSQLAKNIEQLSLHFGLNIDPNKKIYDMSVSEKQTVEIVKVLYRGAKILVLDEPTAVLTPQESKKLFAIITKMKEEGNSIIIITHKLNEVMEVSDRVSVLRKGECVATVETKKSSAEQLTELMVGRAVDLSIERPETFKSDPVLEIVRLGVRNDEGVEMLKDVNFDLRSGEILGVAGVAGSGQKELCEALAGLQKVEKGAILYYKENIVGRTPDEIIRLGISMSFVPEDRLGMGLVASMGMTDNMLLKTYKQSRGGFVKRSPARLKAKALIERLDIITPGTETPVSKLSGGNVQKVLLGREIESQPNVLITAYPVRGLDINSAYTIYDLLNEQKMKGVAILFIGEDLDVLLELCDRIMVLYDGQVQDILQADQVTKEQIGLLMTGQKPRELKEVR